MTLQELHQEWSTDQRIDRSQLDTDATRIPYLHHKYWQYLLTARRMVRECRDAYVRERHVRIEYLMGRMTDADRTARGWEPNHLRLQRQDLDSYLEADVDLQKLKNQYERAQDIMAFTEDIVKTINSRGYLLKTIVDFLRFSQGQ